MLTSIPRATCRAVAVVLASVLAVATMLVGGQMPAQAAFIPADVSALNVSDQEYNPVPGATVTVTVAGHDLSDPNYSYTTTTDADGMADLFAAMPTDWADPETPYYTLYVESPDSSLAPAYWDDQPSESTQTVTIAAGGLTIYTVLDFTTGFSGTVTDAITKSTISEGGWLYVSGDDPDHDTNAVDVGEDGTYQIRVAPGTYEASFQMHSTGSTSAPFGYAAASKSVTVVEGPIKTGVDIELFPNGRISGNVSFLDNGVNTALENGMVRATSVVDSSDVFEMWTTGVFETRTTQNGAYDLDLPPGTYKVAFTEYSSGGTDTLRGLGTQYYNLATSEADATAVTVTAKQEVSGIDALFGFVEETPVITAGTPVISGAATLGTTLSVDEGSWSPSDVTYSYQWYRDSAPISGATGDSYTLAAGDVGYAVSVRVAASKTGLTPASAVSAATAVITDPNPGSATVTVTDSNSDAVSGSWVYLASTTGALVFRSDTTASDGTAHFAALPTGNYTATAYPVVGSQVTNSANFSVTASTQSNVAVQLAGAQVLPPEVTLESATEGWNGLPNISGWEDLDFSVTGTSGAISATYEVTQGGDVLRAGTLTESPAGTYSTVVPKLNTYGTLEFSVVLGFASGPDEVVAFTAYIDPSGTIVDMYGTPVVGATVTLLRSTVEAGPYVAVTDGDTGVMSPSNTTNPDSSDAAGHFGWDVVPGWYKVEATAVIDGASRTVATDALSVPPERLDLVLALPAADAIPAPSTAPSISGTHTEGHTLTAKAGTWPTALGDVASIAVTGYQWTRDGQPIAGATDSSYKLTATDTGTNVGLILTVGRTITADAGAVVSWQYTVTVGAGASTLAATGASTLPTTGASGAVGIMAAGFMLLLVGAVGILLGKRRRLTETALQP